MVRPPRSSSAANKRISIRVTQEEHDLLTQAAEPGILSDWLRRVAFRDGDVLAIVYAREGRDPESVGAEMVKVLSDLRAKEDGKVSAAYVADALEKIVRLHDKAMAKCQADLDAVHKAYEVLEVLAKPR